MIADIMNETGITLHSFTTNQVLTENLAEKIAGDLAGSITARGLASLVVSGGSTPKPLFKHLSLKKIDWCKVAITLADERWVNTSDPSSNEYLARSTLLQHEAAKAKFIGLKNSAATPYEGEQQCDDGVKAIDTPFDIVILGMGEDGHTASLFPGAERLPQAVDLQSKCKCVALTPPYAPHERMTLSLGALLDSRKIILLITGEEKRKVLDKALTAGAAADMPIRYILRQQQTPVEIFWAP